ncbi:flavin reductase family protein [Frankia sp. AgKG'84/4]|uniref:flavin reductase family protein n=1 Tax=Frankia sp. AgKG'84/4 TaxID=573490 RepID=UPI0020106149|nr:flavin reductase family protein [Frankia sp. AgKG'84/4]MCL9792837.1 flavin reductase family protein [Frankia sp. AgKG'84/4]
MPGQSPFHDAVSAISYPMAVVTTVAQGGERSGCLVGFHTQCSIEPPRYLVCISRANHTHRVARHADHLAVHLLDTAAEELATLFGEQTGDEIDKFARCAWWEGPFHLPILQQARAWFAGPVRVRSEVGDHTAFVLEPVDGAAAGPFHQLGFQDVRDMRPGHPA